MSDKDRIEKVHQQLIAFEDKNDLMLIFAVVRLKKIVERLIDGDPIDNREMIELEPAFKKAKAVADEWAKIIHPAMEFIP